MSAETIECAAVLRTGEACGQVAIIHSAQHEYDTLMYQGPGGFQYRLRRSHYEIECPRCGHRMQTMEAARE